MALYYDRKIMLDEFNRPKELFMYLPHDGCTRNEYFEWKAEAEEFGHKEGCLFYNLGCRGPLTHAPCNKILWNRISSKTRAGMPCIGCTEFNFPLRENYFDTIEKYGNTRRSAFRGFKKDIHYDFWSSKNFKKRKSFQKIRRYSVAMAKVEKRILNRVEGDIELKLIWEKGKIKDAFIIAPNFRGFEFILENKPLLDALVITPRVCGICGHAHLIATTNALENLYRENGYEIEVSQKAQLIRNITLSCEIIQNHIRWFYLFVIPDFLKFNTNLKEFYPIKGEKWRKAVYYSSKIVKVIAIFGGQWPHTSYSIPGGVMCEPTQMELMEAISIIDSVLEYFENDIIGMNIIDYLLI